MNKASKVIAASLAVILTISISLYCIFQSEILYAQIQSTPPTVNPNECFSKSTQVGVNAQVDQMVASGIYNNVLSVSQQKSWASMAVFQKKFTVSQSMTTVDSVNSNGSVTCDGEFKATMKNHGKVFSGSAAANYQLIKGAKGEIIFQVPDATGISLGNKLITALNAAPAGG